MLTMDLPTAAPFAYGRLLDFLRARVVPGVESVDGDCYRRRLCIGAATGLIEVSAAPRGVRLSIEPPLGDVAAQIVASVREVFDLDARPRRIAAALGPLARIPGLRVPGAFDPFELAVRAVLGQQVSVKAATTLAARLVAALGATVGDGPLDRRFPSPAQIAATDPAAIAALGIVRQRAVCIVALAEALAAGRLRLAPGVDSAAAYAALVALPGIGDWTAQYILMRAARDRDAFPAADLVLMKALDERSPARLRERAEAWRPWRAYAVMQAWHG
jgi:AraC family transcriptional regulator of adaptative response / DNA-3-methyladenine glycosylase II